MAGTVEEEVGRGRGEVGRGHGGGGGMRGWWDEGRGWMDVEWNDKGVGPAREVGERESGWMTFEVQWKISVCLCSCAVHTMIAHGY